MYPYGLIGNCQISALVSNTGSIDWLCLPRPDSPPVFGKLLDPDGGEFSISPAGKFSSQQSYIPNTNVLETRFFCEDGSEFKVVDFCPRFDQHGRRYRPISLFRIVEPIKGAPQICVTCQPVNGWEKSPVKAIQGNSHFKYEIRNDFMRLITNMSLTYLAESKPFSLNEKIYFGLTWSAGLEEDLPTVANRFLTQTTDYWRTWVKHCSIPTLFQKETIRSALALKLHCYEDTGAILAALTTSLPEDEAGTRNWDYRFCWLRDAAFVLSAFHNLGHFEEIEGFIKFLLDIGHKHETSRERLRPVYNLDQSLPLPEHQHSNWAGFKGAKPVRSNNQAAEHVQNDVYGELVLSLTPIFFDERFTHLRTTEHSDLLIKLFRLSTKYISEPDAGLWELRDGWQEHSFSNLMSWAGIERVKRIHELGMLADLDGEEISISLARAETAVRNGIKNGSLRNGPKDDSYDAALMLLPILRFPDFNLCRQTTLEVADSLGLTMPEGKCGFLYRYLRQDDFGTPQSAFLICSFWLVQALARIEEKAKAIEVMEQTLTAANPLGLLSEHFTPKTLHQNGNYPQAYSHVGLINAAFAISPPWSEIL